MALLTGLLFGAGLAVSGMTNPTKVIGFLDVTGRWDASLAFVMVGAIGVHLVLLRRILRRPRPIYSPTFQLPKRSDIDVPLVLGSAVFGVGWGLSGVCPGPALVDAASGSSYAIVFTVAMALGVLVDRWTRRGAHSSSPTARST
jgi:uncharacterized membrane protein YedE/YeeE